MDPYCEICEKVYSSPASLYIHKKKYHGDNNSITKAIQKKEKSKHLCKYCDKEFSSNSNMHRHMRKCNVKNESLEKIKKMFVNSENHELFDMLLAQQSNSISGNNNQLNNNKYSNSNNTQNIQNNIQNNNNSNNNSNNINIQIVPFGNENLCDVLSANEQIKVLKQKCESLEYLVKHIHFNQKYPQFQNIAITNLKDNVAYKYDEDQNDFVAISKDELLTDLIENRMNDIHDFCTNNEISDKLYNKIDKLAENMEKDEYVLDKKQKMKLIVYNGTGQNKKRKLTLKPINPSIEAP